MKEKNFRVEQFIVLLLLIKPYFNKEEISNLQYYFFIAFIFALKLLKQRARPKTLILIAAFFSSALETLTSKAYIATALLCFAILYYPAKVFLLPPIPSNVGYKRFTIPGKYNSDACVFYPCTTGDVVEVNWMLPGVMKKLYNNRRNTFKVPFFLFSFVLSYLWTYKIKVRNGQVDKNKGVIVFSHGAGGFLHIYSHLLSELAKDYIVVTIQHNETNFNINEEGQEMKARTRQLQARSFALIEALDYFKNQEQVIKLLGDEYKPQSFYLMGHSYGGATVLNTNYITNIQNQVDGIIMLDPWFRALNSERYQIALQSNVIIISFEKYWMGQQIMKYTRKVVENNRERCPELILKGADHMDITDIVYVFGDRKGIDRSRDPEKTLMMVLRIVKEFMVSKKKPIIQDVEKHIVQSPY